MSRPCCALGHLDCDDPACDPFARPESVRVTYGPHPVGATIVGSQTVYQRLVFTWRQRLSVLLRGYADVTMEWSVSMRCTGREGR